MISQLLNRMFQLLKDPFVLVSLFIWIVGGTFTIKSLYKKPIRIFSLGFIWRILISILFITGIIYSGITTYKRQQEHVRFEKEKIGFLEQTAKYQAEIQKFRDVKMSRALNEIKKKLEEEFINSKDKTATDWLRFIGFNLEKLLFEIERKDYKDNRKRLNDYLYSLSLLPKNLTLDEWLYFENIIYKEIESEANEEFASRGMFLSSARESTIKFLREYRTKMLESKKREFSNTK